MIKNPSEKLISNAWLHGWEYLGDGLFCKDKWLGYYTIDGWVKE